MNKLSQAYNYHTLPKAKPVSTECNYRNNTSDKCCPLADEKARKERELKAEDDLFDSELARLGLGAMVWSGES